jgi:hypothetical protein
MKNVRFLAKNPIIRIPTPGFEPKGWGIRLLQHIDQAGYKKGYWLATWNPSAETTDCTFEDGLYEAFREEKDAIEVSRFLREISHIETEVVKVGGH